MDSWSPDRAVEKVKIRSDETAASEDYPSFAIDTGERLHVYREGGEWCVWLNTEAGDFDGICVAVGSSRQEAVARAVAVFEAAERALQLPEFQSARTS